MFCSPNDMANGVSNKDFSARCDEYFIMMLFFPVAFLFLASQCTKKETKSEFCLATLDHIKIKPIHYITSIIYNAVANE